MDDEDHELIGDIDKRVIVIETVIKGLSGARSVLVGLLLLAVAQIGAFIYSYGQIKYQIDNINLGEFEGHIDTLLRVAADHGTELETIRGEHARLRGNIDEFHKQFNVIRIKIDEQTALRFYKSDGDRLDARIVKIEGKVFQ